MKMKKQFMEDLQTIYDELQFRQASLNKYYELLDEEKVKPQAERSDLSLIEKLKFVTENNFKRVSYTEAIDILRNSKTNKKKKYFNKKLSNQEFKYNSADSM